MRFTQVTFTLALAQAILAAPIRRQLAGEGSACNSVFTSTDNGVGYGIEYAEENLSNSLAGAKGRRQLHGEGEACDSLFTQTDNGVGYGVENAEDGIAGNIAGLTGNTYSNGGAGTGGASGGQNQAPHPPPPGPGKGPGKPKRQLDKIANGFGAIGQAAGLNSVTSGPVTQLDNVDGELTSGASDIGASFGSTEENTLESIGKSVPGKRQADKVAKGAAALGQTLGVQKFTDPTAESVESLDGTLTDGVANLGTGIADPEDAILEGTGSAVPVIF